MRIVAEIHGEAVRLGEVKPSLYKAGVLSELLVEIVDLDVDGGNIDKVTNALRGRWDAVWQISHDLAKVLAYLQEEKDT